MARDTPSARKQAEREKSRAGANRKRPKPPKNVKPKLPKGAERKAIKAYDKIAKRMIAAAMDVLGPEIQDLAGQPERSDSYRTDAATDVLIKQISDQWGGILSDTALRAMASEVEKSIRTENEGEMRRVIGIDPTDNLGDLPDEWIKQNVDLIKSIQSDLLPDIEEILQEGQGLRVEQLTQELQDTLDVSRTRARLIARNETHRLNDQLSRYRMNDAGINKVRWSTSGDGAVRQNHRDLDGQVFDLNGPAPLGGGTGRGDRGWPSDAISCRCQVVPVFE